MADLTNAQIAAAFDELGDLYELDGAVSYRVIAYRTAAKAVREASVSVAQLARDGRVTEVCGVGKTLRRRSRRSTRRATSRPRRACARKFPTGLISVMHLPGFGPKRARRLYDELGVDSLDALRAAAEQQKIRGLRGFGAKVEEQLLKTLAETPEGGPAPRILLSRAREHRRADRRRAALAPRRRARRGGRLAAPQGRLRQGPRHHRHGAGPRRAVGRARRAAAGRVRAVRGRRRRARAHALGHEGRPQGRRARPVRQRAPALHGLQGAQRAAARGGGAARAARLGVRDPRRRDGRDAALRDRGGGLRAPRPRVDPAGAARGPRRARGGGVRGVAAPADRGGHPRRPALPHDALRRPPDARADGRGRASRAGSSTSPSPTTPRRTASATTSRRRRSRRGSRRSTRSTRRSTASSCSRGPRSTSSPTARSTTRTSCWPGSTG